MARPLRIEVPAAHVLYDPLMSRPPPIEFPSAIYYVTSRGDRREPIYRSDEDRTRQLEVPRAQRESGSTLQDCLKRRADRGQALRMANRDCGISMSALA